MLKKLSWSKCLSLLIFSIMIGAGACNNSSSPVYIPPKESPSSDTPSTDTPSTDTPSTDTPSTDIQPQTSPLSYEFISANRNFIGGSLIYDIDSASGLTQITEGAKFGVRIGALKEKTETVKSYASGATITSLPSEDNITGESDDPNATVSAITNLSGGTSETKTVYEDVPDKAVYGYISIRSASPESISFAFTTVNPNGATSTKSFSLKKGESCDINGSGINNLKYDAPPLKRTGYSEKARWLTFLNDEKTLTSNMFSKFSAREISAGYQASENTSANIDKGLYAVNSNNDFVYLYYDNYETNNALAETMAYGDYIVCLPSGEGVSAENLEWESEYNNPAEDNENTSENEFYNDLAGLSASAATANFAGKTYIVINGSTSSVVVKDKNEFNSYDIEYEYQLWQFPDEENGPRALLGALNDSASAVQAMINLDTSSANNEILARLNALLPTEEFFTAVLNAKISDAAKRSEAQSAYNKALNNNDKIKFCRLLVDELYMASPTALIEGPDLTSVYPDMVLNLGSPEKLDAFLYSGQRNFFVEDDGSASKSIHSTYLDYKKRHDELEKQWKRFFTIDISQVILYPSDKNKSKKFNPKTAGVYLGAGLRAYVSVSSGRADFEVGMAFWLDLDLNMQTLGVILDYTLNPALAKEMEGPNISLAEKLMAVFGSKVKRIEIKLNDVNINVAGVPLVFGVAAKTGINFKLDGAFDPRICFSGMYGGELKLGASYGVEWFAKPYFRPYANASGINNTEFYIGLGNRAASNTKITFEPWFCLTPSFGLGTSTVSVRGSVPTKFGLHTVMAIPPIKMQEAGVFVSVYFTPYFEADLKFVKIRKDFFTLKPLDHDILFYPEFKTRRR